MDFIIKGGTIVDGASADSKCMKADIGVCDGLIAEIGDLSDSRAVKCIDADGLIVSPGFIDAHAHSEFTILSDGRAEGKVCQGVTTEINGNCGMSAAPLEGPALEKREHELNNLGIKDRWHSFREYYSILASKGFATNFATLTGQGNLRASAAGYENRYLSSEEAVKVEKYINDAMEQGSLGMSTGLIYPPGIFTPLAEIIDMAKETGKYGGVYASHMRSEGDKLLESIEEVIKIASESGVHAHISHLKTSGERNWGKIDDVFKRISSAHNKGILLTCDRYPYTASSTDLDVVLPAWAFEGGNKAEIARLKNDRKRLAREMAAEYPESSDWEKIVVSSVESEKNKWMEGRNICELAGQLGKNEVEAVLDILLEENLNVGAIFFLMNEDNLKAILKQDYTVIGSDSSARSFDGPTATGKPHPRGFGTFPRVLGRYVRNGGVMTLSEAIYKMTGKTAEIFRIPKRGVLRQGYFADITVFDADTIIDKADYSNPYQMPEGIRHVFINGTPVVSEGNTTGTLPGRIVC